MNRQVMGQLVVFSLHKQSLSFPVEEVVEIIRLRPITPVPGTSSSIAGIINLRGKIIPIIHLSLLCKLDLPQDTERSRIVIVAYGEERIGIIVDDVNMVTRVKDDQFDSVPDMPGMLSKEYFRGFVKVDESIVGILHLVSILSQTG